MTKEERHLWYDFLKGLDVPVKRQSVIDRFIVDFYIPSYRIVIELDGSQHYEDVGRKQDSERDKTLRERGLTVLRYANSEIHSNFRGVCEDILAHCK